MAVRQTRTKLYLASRYGRREELCGYRDELNNLGLDVQARWLDGAHQLASDGRAIGEGGESSVEGDDAEAASIRAKFAKDDIDDVYGCDMLVAFTEPPGATAGRGRGGRHVELGLAIATGRYVVVVGPRENIFYWLPEVRHFDTWAEFRAFILGVKEVFRLSSFQRPEFELIFRDSVMKSDG